MKNSFPSHLEIYPDTYAARPSAVKGWAGLSRFRPAFPGDELRFQGTVSAKRLQGGKGIVEVEVEETNAQGEVLGSALISVALPRRDVAL